MRSCTGGPSGWHKDEVERKGRGYTADGVQIGGKRGGGGVAAVLADTTVNESINEIIHRVARYRFYQPLN